MPKRHVGRQIQSEHFIWNLYLRNGIYWADGRRHPNPPSLKRYSLGTSDEKEAIAALKVLDRKKAADLGLAQLEPTPPPGFVTLEEGVKKYQEHNGRPAVTGGVKPRTVQRYKATLDKFIRFCGGRGVNYWSSVSGQLLEDYTKWLEAEDYAFNTQRFELTTIVQAMKWMADDRQRLLNPSQLPKLHVEKPGEVTSTYCYSREEVAAILELCGSTPSLLWLYRVIFFLATTGARIGELVHLRWTDLNQDFTLVTIPDESRQGNLEKRRAGRSTKSGRERHVPLHPELVLVLKKLRDERTHQDGRIFHGPRGRLINPDHVLKVLRRDVLPALADKFPAASGSPGIIAGKVHSFRHYFISQAAANPNCDEQTVARWVGHHGKLIQRYFHVNRAESAAKLAVVNFVPPGTALKHGAAVADKSATSPG